MFLAQRRTLEPGRGLVVIHHHWQRQWLDGLLRGVAIKAAYRQVKVLAGHRGGRKIQQTDFEGLDRPVEIDLGIMVGLLFFKRLLFFIQLFFKRFAPGLLLLHFRQLFLIEGNLCGGFIDRA